MMFNENKKVLKGRHILAQGNALGLRTDKRIVRAMTFIKEKFIFRTSVMTLCFPEMMSCNSLRGFRKLNSVRRKLFAFFIELSRTVLFLHPLPRLRRELSRTAAFRIVPPETLPGL